MLHIRCHDQQPVLFHPLYSERTGSKIYQTHNASTHMRIILNLNTISYGLQPFV